MPVYIGSRRTLLTSKVLDASAYGSYSAPSGYRWDFLTDKGFIVRDNNVPVVDLIRII